MHIFNIGYKLYLDSHPGIDINKQVLQHGLGGIVKC